MFAGTPGFKTSYVIGYPPPPGKFALRGAVIVCAEKLPALSNVFLKTKKFLNQRRL